MPLPTNRSHFCNDILCRSMFKMIKERNVSSNKQLNNNKNKVELNETAMEFVLFGLALSFKKHREAHSFVHL